MSARLFETMAAISIVLFGGCSKSDPAPDAVAPSFTWHMDAFELRYNWVFTQYAQ